MGVWKRGGLERICASVSHDGDIGSLSMSTTIIILVILTYFCITHFHSYRLEYGNALDGIEDGIFWWWGGKDKMTINNDIKDDIGIYYADIAVCVSNNIGEAGGHRLLYRC